MPFPQGKSSDGCFESSHYLSMMSKLEMVAFCIPLNTPYPLLPKSFLVVRSRSLDRLPSTSRMMLNCSISWPGYCFFSSDRKGPYLAVFSSDFFSRFCIHGQAISTAHTILVGPHLLGVVHESIVYPPFHDNGMLDINWDIPKR